MAQSAQITNTKFYAKDPESQDVLDQDDGLNGGSESGSNFWIYALIGVLVIAGIIVLVVCLSGKKDTNSPQKAAYDFGVPASGELKQEDTQKFVKKFYDFAQANLANGVPLKEKLPMMKAALTKGWRSIPEEENQKMIKLLDESEKAIRDQLALVNEAEPVAERINKNKQQEINGVKSVQETVKNFLTLTKEAAEAEQAVIDTVRKIIGAEAGCKDPKVPTTDELKAVNDLADKLDTECDQATSKAHAASQAEPDIKKLFPTEKFTNPSTK